MSRVNLRLRKYVVYPLVRGFDPATGQPGGVPSSDGLAFLWFDTEEDLRAAFASAVGRSDIEHGVQAPIEYQLFVPTLKSPSHFRRNPTSRIFAKDSIHRTTRVR